MTSLAPEALSTVIRYLLAGSPLDLRPQTISKHSFVNKKWGLRAIRWFDPAVDPTLASTIKVAVLGTRIDTKHPDFAGIPVTYRHTPATAANIVGHGTHVNNHRGIAGVCRCDLQIWKIFDDQPAGDGECYVDELMYQRALGGARSAGVNVMNLSIGGTALSQTEADLLRRVLSAGVTVVAAMGNGHEEGNPIEYPGAYAGVLPLRAVDEADSQPYFSNTGKHIALFAPSVNVLFGLPTTHPAVRVDTPYAPWSGTSMATTPHVAAAAALALAETPGLGPKDVRKQLRKTATRIPGKATEVGAGLLNLAAELA